MDLTVLFLAVPSLTADMAPSSTQLLWITDIYGFLIAGALIASGALGDRLGRRRVMAVGFATATLGVLLFAVAQGLAWLFAARAVQGLAVGMISGAAAAALVELDPAPQEDRAALFAALAQAGGSASGPFLAGMLAEWAPARLVLPFAIFATLGALTVVAALALPEPGRVTPGRPKIVRPSVPPEIRGLFVRVSVTGAAVWAVAALFLSVVPSYAADLLDTSDLALLGAVSAVMLATSCAAQIAIRRARAHAGLQASGLALLAAGLLALVLAFPARSLAVLVLAGLLTGIGHGLAFLGAQAQLNLAAPPDRRGEVNAAFYTLIYLGVAASIVTAGLLTLEVSLRAAVTAFAVAIAAVAVATAAWHLRRAPAAR
jgi:MFS family permease